MIETRRGTHRTLRTARRWFVGAAIPLAIVGCGNLTAGGFGEAHLYVDGDGEPGSSGGALASALPADGATAPSASLLQGGPNAFEGDVTVRLRVYLRGGLGVMTELTPGAQEVVVDVQGGVRAELARQEIPAGTYDRIRLVFERIEANLTGGPPGQQLPPDGRIFVDLGDEPLEVERPVTVILQSGDTVELTIDLRSGAWLRSAALGVVLPVQFRNALRVTVN